MSAYLARREPKPAFWDQFRILTRYRNFSLLWSGQVVSHIGDAFYGIALIWLVQELTGSRTLMGAISAVVSFTALSGLVSGALVDRWDRRRTMVISDVLRAMIIMILPVLIFADRLQLWHLFVVGAVMGIVSQFFYPAKQSLIPHLVAPADLTAANALSQMAQMLLLALGYGLGGVFLGMMTAGELFALDGVTFALSALAIAMIRLPMASQPDPGNQASAVMAQNRSRLAGLATLSADIMSGLRYMRRDPLIAATIPVAIVANFVFAPLTVLLAAWAKDILLAGAQGYGLLEGSLLIGGLAGTVAVSSLTERFRRRTLVLAGMICMGLPLVAIALFPVLMVNSALLMVMGFFNAVVNVSLITVFQQRVPDEMMGRLFGTLTAMAMMATPLGVALGGFIADYVSIAMIFAFMGLAMSLLGLSLVRNPAFSELT